MVCLLWIDPPYKAAFGTMQVGNFLKKLKAWWRKFFNPNVRRGREGERAAVRFLERQKYKILARNWMLGRYELDIVAQKAGCIVFIEVRGRAENSFRNGYYSVNRKKKDALKKAVYAFLKHHRKITAYRFDIISIAWNNDKITALNHYENVPLR